MPNREPTAKEIASNKLYQEMGLTDAEYHLVCDQLGRQPNFTETGIYSVMWSEHCSYKNSKPLLSLFPTEGSRVLQGPGEGAGIVDIGDGQAVVFKIESHNHPSAIAPYSGASTGVGGIIRDIFSMGARPVALLNSLRFGPLDDPHSRYLFEQVVAGIAGYGNDIGIPSVGGEVVFEARYRGNPLVNAMCVGVIDHQDIQKGIAEGTGNLVVYVGARTGRDGIHGATFASEELDDASEEKRASVPFGNPQLEKRVLEACLELVRQDLIVGIQDMGAAGLTSSSAEMASKAGSGMKLDLDRVPQREADMTPYEMMLSESQERMLLVIEPKQEAGVRAVLDKWDLHMAVIGQVTDDGNLSLVHRGENVCQVPVSGLVEDAPVYHREAQVPSYYMENAHIEPNDTLQTDTLGDALKKVLQSPTVASKQWAYQQFDDKSQGNTAVPPGSDAAVIRLRGTDKALAMSTDGNGRYVFLDPRVGGAIAVAEAARNVVCSGAEPLALTDGLNFGNPEKPEVYWQMAEAIKGMCDASEVLKSPVISGNVSLYNETQGKAIYPTPVVGMVGLVHDIAHVTTQAFKRTGDAVILLGDTLSELGGSEWQYIREGQPSGRPPQLDLQKERRVQQLTLQAIQSGWVASAHDLAEGGLAVALSEACIANGFGAEVDLEMSLTATEALFSESQSRILLSVPTEHVNGVLDLAAETDVLAVHVGQVTQSGALLHIKVNGKTVVRESVADLTTLWEGAIPCLMNPS